ncbi:MAG: type II CAAX endopeptidase family protein [Eubacteriales bacterium]
MKKQFKFYHGLILFGVVLALMISVFSFAQYYFGIWGLAITELGFLAVTLAAGYIVSHRCEMPMKSIFPLNPPPIKQFFAGAFIYGGAYMAMIPVALLTQLLFPSMAEVTDNINSIGTQESAFITVIIMAVLPAICEETLHRGFILSSFKGSMRRADGSYRVAATVICMGAIFGLFHLDPYRFLPTAILGGAFAYIALKTDSMLLTMIFHFLNNLMSVVAIVAMDKAGAIADQAAAAIEYTPAIIAGTCLIYIAAAVMLLFIGIRLFSSKRASTLKIFAAVISSIIIFAAGMTLTSVEAYRQMDSQGIDIFSQYGVIPDESAGGSDIIKNDSILDQL